MIIGAAIAVLYPLLIPLMIGVGIYLLIVGVLTVIHRVGSWIIK